VVRNTRVRTRLVGLIVSLVILLAAVAVALAARSDDGSGSDGSGSGETQTVGKPPAGPDVITTEGPGGTGETEGVRTKGAKPKAGGGSSATCIGC
jgi:hypothetical protein